MDYNDRQVDIECNLGRQTGITMAENILKSHQSSHAFIYLDTIGKCVTMHYSMSII